MVFVSVDRHAGNGRRRSTWTVENVDSVVSLIGPENESPSATNVVLVVVLLVVIKSTKAFPFHNRSSPISHRYSWQHYPHSTIAPWRIFKLSWL